MPFAFIIPFTARISCAEETPCCWKGVTTAHPEYLSTRTRKSQPSSQNRSTATLSKGRVGCLSTTSGWLGWETSRSAQRLLYSTIVRITCVMFGQLTVWRARGRVRTCLGRETCIAFNTRLHIACGITINWLSWIKSSTMASLSLICK